MDKYKLEGRTFDGIKFKSLFETDNLVNYGIENKILNNAFEIEIWKLIQKPVECSELMLLLEKGEIRHGRDLYENIYNSIEAPTRKEAVLALPLLASEKDKIVVQKHKLVRRAA